jgi:UDP-N-acetylglucosamine/UDP-N-acetylgalactosamine diphosphorylase
MLVDEANIRETLARHGQDHVLRFWSELNRDGREELLGQLSEVDFPLIEKLVSTWVKQDPPPEHFERIESIPVLPPASPQAPGAREAWDAGEDALRAGRVGLVLVAGGQGTRLGFEGPKGAYPIGPVTQRSLFAYHADKIHNVQKRYGCRLPWYIMVSDATHEATEIFFSENDYFGLRPVDVQFFRQSMMPCVDADGRLMLEAPSCLARNPNGHGGSIPALVESGVIDDATRRGVDTLSYFQVDNWAARVADPYFVGYHVLGNGEMSSKVHRKCEPRESVGVHCLCDGEYRVIEYTELDLYPQLLDVDEAGNLKHFAGNPAIHILATGFVERTYDRFEDFPWHCAHKKVPYLNEEGDRVQPDTPNAYKFETFVFDALRYVNHEPIALEILAAGEYTPIKQFTGSNSVVAAREAMNVYWAGWLEAAGTTVPRHDDGKPAVNIEISPRVALWKDEFVAKARGRTWEIDGDLWIDEGAVGE